MFLTALQPVFQLGKQLIPLPDVKIPTFATINSNPLTGAEKKAMTLALKEEMERAMRNAVVELMVGRVKAGYEDLSDQLVVLADLCVPGLVPFNKEQPAHLVEMEHGKCYMTIRFKSPSHDCTEFFGPLKKVLNQFVNRPEFSNQFGNLTVETRHMNHLMFVHVHFPAIETEE